MENKQIVDDVQIRGCGHYWNGTCHAYTDNTGKFLLCVNSPHCYFKQLKRKEQECERLKEEVSLLKESNSKLQQIEDVNSLEKCYLQQLDQLKKTNEELQKENEKLKKELMEKDEVDIFFNTPIEGWPNDPCEICQHKAENEKLKKQVCGLRPELKYIIDKTCSKYNIQAKTYHEKIVEIISNLDKLKQILTEIKEICKTNVCKHCYSKLKVDDNYCKNIKDCDCYKILQKISECGVNND